MTTITFADNVRIRHDQATDALGISGRVGQVYGITTPSVTGIEYVGPTAEDRAINVHIEELDKQFWLSPELVEFVDRAPGTTIDIGNKSSVRNADGSWRSPWRRFWS